jgi:hypothetical protein
MIILQELGYNPDIYKIYRLSGEVTSYIVFAIAVWAIINYSKFKGMYWWLFLNICISAVLELSALVLVKLAVPNTQFINHIYPLQEAITIGLFYFFAFQNKSYQKYIQYVLTTFAIMILFNAFWKEGYLSIPSKILIIENFIFFILSLLLFYQVSLSVKSGFYRKTPIFWFNLYVFISFISTFLFFVVIDKAMAFSNDLSMIIYTIKNTISMLCYGFWIMGTLRLNNADRIPIN